MFKPGINIDRYENSNQDRFIYDQYRLKSERERERDGKIGKKSKTKLREGKETERETKTEKGGK